MSAAERTPRAERPALLHVGYHKTGTTWLQDVLFRSPEIGLWAVRRPSLTDALILPNTLDFEAVRCRAEIAPLLEDAVRRGRVPVISHERFSGSPHAGGFDSGELAGRLAAVFGDARVLIGVREQRSAILSTYKQYVRVGGPASLRAYLDPPTLGRERIPGFDFAHFQYDRLVSRYVELFGRERVSVVPYELMVADARAFAASALDALGVVAAPEALDRLPYGTRLNPALSGAGVIAKARLNRLLSRDRVNPAPLLPLRDGDRILDRVAAAADSVVPSAGRAAAERRLRAHIAEMVGDRYRSSNSRLAELFDLDLAGYGYEVAGAST